MTIVIYDGGGIEILELKNNKKDLFKSDTLLCIHYIKTHIKYMYYHEKVMR